MTWGAPNRRALPFAEWPEQDRRAWIAAQTSLDDDLLADRKPAAAWRPGTRELHCRCYAIWLAWLRDQGVDLADEAPADRATRARLAAYICAQRARGSEARTLVNHLVGLRHMLGALAPDRDWRWMLLAIEKLKTQVVPTKNHYDLPHIGELFWAGIDIMHRVLALQEGFPKQHAILFRNGLAIALLAARPLMRRGNLGRIRIGQHLIEEGLGYRLQFSEAEMKGCEERNAPVPDALTPYIQRYIDIYRPILLSNKADPTGTLFISGLGNPIAPKNLSDEIGKTTDLIFGRRICAHEFRHATASSIAKVSPEHVGDTPIILGHADPKVAEEWYTFVESHHAFRKLDDALDRLLSGDLPQQKTKLNHPQGDSNPYRKPSQRYGSARLRR
jgi:integrase